MHERDLARLISEAVTIVFFLLLKFEHINKEVLSSVNLEIQLKSNRRGSLQHFKEIWLRKKRITSIVL